MTRSIVRAAMGSAIVLVTVTRSAAAGQVTAPQAAPLDLTLEQAIQYATEHYPTVKAAIEQVNSTLLPIAKMAIARIARMI